MLTRSSAINKISIINYNLEDHIKWATKNNQLDEIGKYLRSLPESDWAHYGEI